MGRTGGTSRKAKVRAWAQAYPGYWRAWRAENAAYREREALRMRRKRAGLRRVAKQTLRRESLVEKLLAVKRLRPRGVAKQTVIARRVEALTDALIWSETVAKHRVMGVRAESG